LSIFGRQQRTNKNKKPNNDTLPENNDALPNDRALLVGLVIRMVCLSEPAPDSGPSGPECPRNSRVGV